MPPRKREFIITIGAKATAMNTEKMNKEVDFVLEKIRKMGWSIQEKRIKGV